jgi:hypothetical protein
LEGTLTVEYVVAITLDHSGDPAEADALLDAFLAAHADASPVVGEDLKADTIDVTFAVEAGDGYEAFERGRRIFASATKDSALARPVVGVSVELVEDRELEPA